MRKGEERNDVSSSCRVCHGQQGTLIRACECRGTCGAVHASCLQMWIGHRQAAGMSTREATTCELCLRPFAHRLERAHVARFFLSRGAWRAWAHIAYLAFCARRVWDAGSIIKNTLMGCGRQNEQHGLGLAILWQRGRVWSKVRVTAVLALHYWLLLILDARLLMAVFRRWRDVTTKIVVCDKDGQPHVSTSTSEDDSGLDSNDEPQNL